MTATLPMSNFPPNRRARLRPAVLLAFVLIQTIAAAFFLGDAANDLMATPADYHTLFEAFVALALVAGVILGTRELRVALSRLRDQAQALATAKGALADVIAAEFERWGLTPAERDVGLLALKGFDVAEIAALRSAAQGTVRAQLSQIYAKAGVSGRAQFAAIFVEELLAGPLETDGAKAT
ncbi:MAG: helix-turn-helix transcriptional regulator [Paracoccaceae bacterium]